MRASSTRNTCVYWMLCVRKNLKCSSCIVPYFYQKFRKYRARNVLFGRFVSPIPTFLCLRPGSPFLFPPSLSFSFLSSSCPFARKPRLRDLHLLYQFRFPLFKVARYLVPDPPTLSPLYPFRAITVRSPTWRRPFLYSISTSTRFDRTRFVRLSIPGSYMAIVVTELVVDIFARILFVSAKGTCNIPVSFVENRYKLDVNR